MFSTIRKTDYMFWVTFKLSSANAFNLDKFKNVSSGKELKKHAGWRFRWCTKTITLNFDRPSCKTG